MILQPKDFKKKLTKNVIITDKELSDIFEDIVEDKQFMDQLNEGFTTYIMLDIRNETLNICNVKKSDNSEDESILDKEDILAVKAFEYLKEVVSH